jgi:phosphoglucomutase
VPCDVITGTDPDCDRVAIAVPTKGSYQKLSGNELGCLLMNYVLKARKDKSDIPEGAIVVRSIVSSPLADRIAEHYGVSMKAVLTGFKYIGGEILKLEETGQEDKFIFGFEESCGYLKGTYARDKDAVIASMLVCELAAVLKMQGKTILDALDSLYAQYGQYLAYVQSVELSGADAMEKAAEMMSKLRENTPATIGGTDVTVVKDYRSSISRNLITGEEITITLPKSNVLEFVLGNQGSVIARPSGTEPKVKFYYTAVGETKQQAQCLLDAMVAQMSK